jgi:hypothetical protein
MKVAFVSNTRLGNLANFFVAALYDSSADSVVVESVPIPKIDGVYGNPFQWTFATDLIVSHTYTIKLWESPDNTVSGSVVNSTSFTAYQNISVVRLPIYAVVGQLDGWVAGTNNVDDITWVGWNVKITRNGAKIMMPQGEPGVVNPDVNIKSTGGFTLIKAGDKFGVNEEWVVEFIPQLAPAAAPGQPSPVFSSSITLTAATTLDPTYLDTAILLKGAGASLPITLLPLSAMADFKFIYLFSNGGNHINAPIICSGTDKILYNGFNSDINGLISTLVLGQCENLILYKANGVFNVFNDLIGINKVGELVAQLLKPMPNTIFADGSLLSRTTYSRLWAYVQKLPSSALVSLTTWTNSTVEINDAFYYNKRGCYNTGDGSTTFGIPLLYTPGFLRAVDGATRLAGDFDFMDVMPHTHIERVYKAANNGGTNPVGFLNVAAGGPVNSAVETAPNEGTETKPSNTGVYMLIRI